MVLGSVFIVLGSGVAGSLLTGDTKLPKLGDVFSGAAKFVKKHEGGAAKSGSGSSDNQNTSQQLLSQINYIREELHTLQASTPTTVVTSAVKSGSGPYAITAGWNLSDMMFVTRRGLSEACSAVGSHLDKVSDSVVVTRKHLAGRIARVDISLDETQQIIEGTRDEVGIIHGDLSAFQEDLQSVNLVVRTLESKMGRLECSQDQMVDGINHLCEFTRKLEYSQTKANISSPSVPAVMDSSYSERIVEKATSCLPRLALEAPNSPVVPRPEETSLLQVAEQPKALKEQEKENEEGASQTCQASSSSTKAAAAAAASTNTRRKASSSRLGALWMPVIGTLLRASAIN
ncbi:hypothetical protein Zm00014a_041723 [Zea mays]|uniref:DUF1664 domain-containing protein n=2 Tax=Zea mays TaxID=4577 RepID=A0A3L6DQK3_MAIZE|nr:Putative DUF1664 domain family protein [Zea mays]PWZ11002.1 hypothetical protein Zm00014a_041723 [Zea mays]